MNDDLPNLIFAAVAHSDEDTPVAMLADHLIEQGDGRGEVLRRWLEKGDRIGSLHNLYGPRHEQVGEHKLSAYPLAGSMKWSLICSPEGYDGWSYDKDRTPERVKTAGFSVGLTFGTAHRGFRINLPPEEARQIADALPNAAEVHKFLDTHFGPDPRYNDSLNKALKPEQE